jgi:hypothetical protein
MPTSANFVGPTYWNQYNKLMDKAAQGNSWEDTIEGSPYLFKDWRKGVVEYKDKLFKFDKIRYDVHHNLLEIETDDQVKVLDNIHCDKFLISEGISDNYIEFSSGKDFRLDGAPLIGYFETYYKNDVTILLKPSTSVKKADWNEVTLTGSKRDKVTVFNEIYFEKDGDLNRIKNKKDLQKFYGNKGSAVIKFVKKNKIDIKSPDDLIAVVNAFNHLTP